MCTFKCCGIFCSGLSVFCMLTLLVAGIFLNLHSPSIHVPIINNMTHEESYDHAAKNAFVGVGIYAVILALSIGCILFDRFKRSRAPLAQPLLSQNNNQNNYQQQINQYH